MPCLNICPPVQHFINKHRNDSLQFYDDYDDDEHDLDATEFMRNVPKQYSDRLRVSSGFARLKCWFHFVDECYHLTRRASSLTINLITKIKEK